jgi:hypothetical protein
MLRHEFYTPLCKEISRPIPKACATHSQGTAMKDDDHNSVTFVRALLLFLEFLFNFPKNRVQGLLPWATQSTVL